MAVTTEKKKKKGKASDAKVEAVVTAVCLSMIDSYVKGMLKENEQRLANLFGDHDQLTGYGMDGHTEKVKIKGFPIEEQWLTEEVASNPLFVTAKKCGSIKKLQDYYWRQQGLELSEDELIEELTYRRIERDPSFAFYVCYRITDKASGDVVPFKLNFAQRKMLWELEKMRLAGEPIFMVLLKARQWGGSTLAQLYMSWIQLFVRDGWNSIILAQTKDTARRIKGMYTLTLKEFPYFVFKVDEIKFSPFERSNADSVVTDRKGMPLRRCTITVASYENYESARGANIAMAHFSEVAYWRTTPMKSAESLITNIDGGMSKGHLNVQIIESTAKGNTGFFYNEYQLAKAGKSNRKALFVPFTWLEKDMLPFKSDVEKAAFARWLYEHKDEQNAPDETHEPGSFLWYLWSSSPQATLEHINWYIKDRAGKHSHEAEASEAPANDYECFAFSGNKVFSTEFVEAMRDEYKRVPAWVGDIREYKNDIVLTEGAGGNNQLKIWKRPNALKTVNEYVVIVDLGGKRDGADYSVITVINRWGLTVANPQSDPDDPTEIHHLPLEVVARWRGHLRYDLVAWKAVAIAKYYKNAELVFESNSFDQKKAQSEEFVETGDHMISVLDEVGDAYENLYRRRSTDAEDVKTGKQTNIGFQTNKKTKQQMVDKFDADWTRGGFIDPDEIFYTEAGIYEQRQDGSYGNIAGRGNHDDVLMTDMIGNMVSDEMEMPRLAGDKEGMPVVI